MKAHDIEKYLAQLGRELANSGIVSPIHILLIGGAFMLTQTQVRRMTNDIDVLPLDEDQRDIATGTPLAVALWNAAHAVAARHRLHPLWFNTLIVDFVRAAGDIPHGTHWRTYGPLEVYLPPKEYMLALKLVANREKDQADIAALCQELKICTRQQAQRLITMYIPDQEEQHLFAIPTTLNTLFPA
ncbi:hypothetical protein EPA93_29345 [Ktedonosporobacter rubrisoli]|uniref:Nucleotidyl transferase AbiEii/AbiGii toxin family protein n=1 Tax=Ktedonosporobacter rubrisoli TaxID=2509675 RepID=A0A4P6JWC0_KTERU|nr:hypothetical protein [Ktedonosporobacter rubrisoli]QBD79864.1 hypothetical protein EPA93_29345 [Ktedonosporobacter rubrisoli]